MVVPVSRDYEDTYRRRISDLFRSHMIFEIPEGLRGSPSGVYQVELLRDGTVRNVKIVSASPLAGFDEAAIRAIKASSLGLFFCTRLTAVGSYIGQIFGAPYAAMLVGAAFGGLIFSQVTIYVARRHFKTELSTNI